MKGGKRERKKSLFRPIRPRAGLSGAGLSAQRMSDSGKQEVGIRGTW